MLYKLIRKIYRHLEINDVKKKLHYKSKKAKDTIIIDENVKILNPNVTIGENVHLYNNTIIFGDGEIEISDNVKIGFNSIIYASQNGGIKIGKNTIIAANAYIIDTNHSTKIGDNTYGNDSDTSMPMIIGDSVWISAECVIAMGSVLKNGVIVGANSFVNKEFPENSIIAGSPAKIIKYRD